MTLIRKPFDELTLYELFEIVRARFDVFVGEQHILEPEYDDVDYRSIHLFIPEDGRVVAYARLFPGEQEGQWQLGRMLTIRRKEGLGAAIIRAAQETAKERGGTQISLHAQVQAQGFYERQGFKPCSAIFEEAGIPHIEMTLNL